MSERPIPDLAPLRPILGRHAAEGRGQLIPAFFEAQAIYGYLPERVVEAIGEGLGVPLAKIHAVIEFHTMLHPQPTGRRCACPPVRCAPRPALRPRSRRPGRDGWRGHPSALKKWPALFLDGRGGS